MTVRELEYKERKLNRLRNVLDILVKHDGLTRKEINRLNAETFGAIWAIRKLKKMGVIYSSKQRVPMYRITSRLAAYNCFYNLSGEIDSIKLEIKSMQR